MATIIFDFLDIHVNGISFPSNKNVFLNEFFVPTFCLLEIIFFYFFFCWWTQFLKLGGNQFSSIFLFLTAEAVFSASRNGFFIEYFIPASGNRFSA